MVVIAELKKIISKIQDGSGWTVAENLGHPAHPTQVRGEKGLVSYGLASSRQVRRVVREIFSPEMSPGNPPSAGVGEKKSRIYPTHSTTRRTPMGFNGLLAVGRREVRQWGPLGC